MESSVDPPILISVNLASSEQQDARDVASLPNMTGNVTVIQDVYSDANTPVSILNSPRPLSVLAAEATISYLRNSSSSAIDSTGTPRPTEYSWADILLDAPTCQCHNKSSNIRRSLSSEELVMYHPTRPTLTRCRGRPKANRPGVQAVSSKMKLVQDSATMQQWFLPSNRVLPPLEPSRRTRFLITYNYIQNRFRILQFTMETRPNQVGSGRFMRHAFIPRALLNQIRGFGSPARLRRLSAMQRAAQDDHVPRAVRRQHQLLRSVSRSRQERDSNQRGRNTPQPSTSRHQSDPRASSPVDIIDLGTVSSLPTVMSTSASLTDSLASIIDPRRSPSTISLTDNFPPSSTLNITNSQIISSRITEEDSMAQVSSTSL